MAQARYTLHELADAATAAESITVAERALQRYVEERLIPPAIVSGAAVYYRESHLLRLRLVLRLVQQYVPLGEIRRWLAGLDDAQVRALIGQPPMARMPSEGDAQAYLARLTRTARGHDLLLRPFPPSPLEGSSAGSAPAASLPPGASRGDWTRIALGDDVELLVRAGSRAADVIEELVTVLQTVLPEGAG